MTIAEVAQRSGLTAVYLSDIENGKRDPCYSAIERVANGLDNGLGMKTSELMGRMGEMGECGWTEEMEETAARYEGASASQRMIAVAMLGEVFSEMRRRVGR